MASSSSSSSSSQTPLLPLLLLLLMAAMGAAMLERETTPGCPSKCRCDSGLKKVECQGRSLVEIPADLPPSVEELHLDHNLITAVSNVSLAGLVNLRILLLTNNKISSVEEGALRDLARLEQLFLNNNLLDSLKATAVRGASSLKFLDLEYNRFTRIPSLGDLTSLQTLVLQGNVGLTDPTFPRDFKYIKNLKDIVLSGSKFSKLGPGTFASLAGSNVQKLELSRSTIFAVDPATFKPLASLKSLKIGYNPLVATQLANVFTGLRGSSLTSLNVASVGQGESAFPLDTLAGLNSTMLTTLELNYNRIRQLPDHAFAMFPALVHLDLSNCGVDSTAPDPFSNLTHLGILFLNDNQLTSVPTGLPVSLQKLYLNGNGFTMIPNDSFLHLKYLEELYLGNNKIHQLSEDSLRGLTALKILHLSGNIIATLPSRLFSTLVRLQVLELNNNNLQAIKPTPELFHSQAGLHTLNLASNGLRYIPPLLLAPLQSLITLKLEENHLGPQLAGDFSGQTFQGLSRLQQLFLQNNGVTGLPEALFKNLAGLLELYLRGNRLSHWGPGTFQPASLLRHLDLSENLVSVINQSSLAALPRIQSLNLSGNPFQCSCALCWFRQWAGNHTKILTDVKDYRCDSPPSWQGKPLLLFSCDKIDCTDYTLYWVLGGVCAGFLLCFLLISLIYNYRWHILFKYYALRKSKQKHRRHGYQEIPDAEFDGYICYAEEDSQWVREHLYKIFGGDLKLCFRDVDFHEGRSVINSFCQYIDEVRLALIVVSDSFLEDKWAKFEMERILDHAVHREIPLKVLVIKRGRIHGDIPRPLQPIFQRNDYLEYPDAPNIQEDFKQRLDTRINA